MLLVLIGDDICQAWLCWSYIGGAETHCGLLDEVDVVEGQLHEIDVTMEINRLFLWDLHWGRGLAAGAQPRLVLAL